MSERYEARVRKEGNEKRHWKASPEKLRPSRNRTPNLVGRVAAYEMRGFSLDTMICGEEGRGVMVHLAHPTLRHAMEGFSPSFTAR